MGNKTNIAVLCVYICDNLVTNRGAAGGEPQVVGPTL